MTSVTGKRKGKKGTHNNFRMNDNEDVIEDGLIQFTGKKKSKSKAKKLGHCVAASGFALLGDETCDVTKDEKDDASVIFCEEKSSESIEGGNILTVSAFNNEDISVLGLSVDDVADLDEDCIMTKLSGKKKSPKKRNSDTVSAVDKNELPTTSVTGKEEDVLETSKNKKKKKKGGRTALEEDEVDKILAELAALELPREKFQPHFGPAVVADEGVEKEAIEDTVDSAAAKKKKKKKEKEKEKKAAGGKTTATIVEEDKLVESKVEVADKKVPKHVREMQQILARRKEEEEKKKKEEEEKLMKEEEERLRQEEVERIAQEKRKKKKEREKEKILTKKREGKPVTSKQKAEAQLQLLESMRNQYLADVRGLSVVGTGETSREPTKVQQANDLGSIDADKAENKEDDGVDLENVDKNKKDDGVDLENVDENKEGADVDLENVDENKENDEWDAKSWDDVDLKLPGVSTFADMEEAFEPELVIKNQDFEHKESQLVAKICKQDVNGKNKEKEEEEEEEEEEGEMSLRSPICCIMGHVDAGKTKLLDCIRRTNVQEGEAGGITQQIGATYIPADNIRERTKELKADAKLNVPGLLVIDTPGHESFKNLRSRGSGLCDIAILVVNIMKGIEPQTIESLNLLRMRNTDFILALNQVDRLYGWKTCCKVPFAKAMKQQPKHVQLEFDQKVTQITTQFKEQGLNTELYYKNKHRGETYNIVPTSAISGEGIPEMLLLLVQWAQKTMVEKLTYRSDIQCTVLEVKVIEGLGTTIDVVLVNGVLHEGDEIVVCGFQGPIHTTIRALLTPSPMRELRVKGTYFHHKEIKAAQGIKITAQNLEHAVAGTSLYVVGPDDDVEDIKKSVMKDMRNVMSRIDKSGEGVYVQASTLGSLEALLEYLKTPDVNIPVSGIGIGPLHKNDVRKASVMLDKKKEFASILAFDVKLIPEARDLADKLGVKIFVADVIYHLVAQFKVYVKINKEESKKKAADDAVFPCVLQIMPNCVFNKCDPIILGVVVLEGILKIGTPICIPKRDFINIGRISSIRKNNELADSAKKGQEVSVKIKGCDAEQKQKMFGRHFGMEDALVSHISRKSIDVLKYYFRDELSKEQLKLLCKLKHLFKIQ